MRRNRNDHHGDSGPLHGEPWLRAPRGGPMRTRLARAAPARPMAFEFSRAPAAQPGRRPACRHHGADDPAAAREICQCKKERGGLDQKCVPSEQIGGARTSRRSRSARPGGSDRADARSTRSADADQERRADDPPFAPFPPNHTPAPPPRSKERQPRDRSWIPATGVSYASEPFCKNQPLSGRSAFAEAHAPLNV